MQARFPRIDWLAAFAGISVALTLLTNSRGGTGVGVGEVGIAIVVALGLLRGLGRPSHVDAALLGMPHLLLSYVLAVLLPLTLIHSYAGTAGTSLRDWVAYLLSFLFLLSLHQARANLLTAGKFFALCLVAILAYQYMLGGGTAWYSLRFTGGAKNPNQLALYCVCAGVMVSSSFKNRTTTILLLVLFIFFGVQARSDAFGAALLAGSTALVAIYILPQRALIPLGIPLSLAGLALLIYYLDTLLNLAGLGWSSADEGGGRLTLYKNGLLAWLDSVGSVLIGNGAGSFSGLLGPFQMAEAHNTPIDMLSIGGLVGAVLFYAFPVRLLVRSYQARRLLLFSMIIGMLVFSIFHFVARQPVWWFAVLCAGSALARRHPQVPGAR